jgi:hypothetical protein
MAQFYSGQDGILKVGGETAGKVRSWSFTANQAVLETTSLGDKNRTLEAGVRSLTGSCSLYYYNDTANVVSDLLGKVSSATGTASMAAVTMELNMTKGGTTKRITMDAFITSYSMSNAQGEISSADVSFEATGAPTTLDM